MSKQSQICNLDHAAGAPLSKEAKKALKEVLDSPTYNTDSSYSPAVELRRNLADLKSKTAKLIGAKSPNIFITQGSSDATSKLFNLLSQADPKAGVVTTNVEHSSLLEQLNSFNKSHILKVGSKEMVNLKKLGGLITNKTVLVTVQYVNNETGQVLPIKDISRLIREVREERRKKSISTPIFFHTDSSQAAITQDLHIPRLGVDAMSLNGSKFGALPSTGILYLSADILRWLGDNSIQTPEAKENPLAITSLYHSLARTVGKKNTESKRLFNLAQAFWTEFNKLVPEAELIPKSLKISKN